MPANVVKSPQDEAHWAAAKASVKKSHPDLSEDDDRFWALVNGAFQHMKHHTGSKPVEAIAKAELGTLGRGFMALLKAATVKEPGSRGGKFYYDQSGAVRYGNPPKGSKIHHAGEKQATAAELGAVSEWAGKKWPQEGNARVTAMLHAHPHLKKVWQHIEKERTGKGTKWGVVPVLNYHDPEGNPWGPGYTLHYENEKGEKVGSWNGVGDTRERGYSHSPSSAWDGVRRNTVSNWMHDVDNFSAQHGRGKIPEGHSFYDTPYGSTEEVNHAIRHGLRIVRHTHLPDGVALGDTFERASGDRVKVVGREDVDLIVQNEKTHKREHVNIGALNRLERVAKAIPGRITMAHLFHRQRHFPPRPGEPPPEALSWLQRALARIGFGKAEVKEPGKRGGKFRYTKTGKLTYRLPSDAPVHDPTQFASWLRSHIDSAKHAGVDSEAPAERSQEQSRFAEMKEKIGIPDLNWTDHFNPERVRQRVLAQTKHHVVEARGGYLHHPVLQQMRDNPGNRADLERWHKQRGETVEFKDSTPVAKAGTITTAHLFGKAEVKEPGKRGGKFYYDEHGAVQYGAPPTGARSFGTGSEFAEAHKDWGYKEHEQQSRRHEKAKEKSTLLAQAVMHRSLSDAHKQASWKKRNGERGEGNIPLHLDDAADAAEDVQKHHHDRPAALPANQNERMWEAGASRSYKQQHPAASPAEVTYAVRRIRDEQDRLAGEHNHDRTVKATNEPTARKLSKATLQLAHACREIGVIDVDGAGRLVKTG